MAFICLISFVLLASGADAQPQLMKEPERYAFIVGNARYSLHGSEFDDLDSACDEAVAFRQLLIAIGWPSENIFPRIQVPVKDETPEVTLRRSICDLSNEVLERKLKGYVNLLMAKDNPYGVVYYAGHGAEAAGEYYAFGVDANVDFDEEAKRVGLYPNYEMFAAETDGDGDKPTGTAVNISRIVAQVNGPKNKGILVILDACRNNAVLDTFIKKHGAGALPINYFSGPSERYDGILTNMFILYSTRPGKTAADGEAEQSTRFATGLQKFMSDSANLRESAPSFVNGFKQWLIAQQQKVPSYERQIPQIVGSMATKPVFCFKGCPQPAADFDDAQLEVLERQPAAANPVASITGSVGRLQPFPVSFFRPIPTGAARPEPQQSFSRRYETSFPPVAPSLSSKGGAIKSDRLVETNRPADPNTARIAQQIFRPLYFDVFYCVGDVQQGLRQDAARAFAQAARNSHSRSEALEGYNLEFVRLRALSPATNLAYQKPIRDVIITFPTSGPQGAAWAGRLKGPYVATPDASLRPNVVRAYFCADFTLTEPPSKVYMQVSRTYQKSRAEALIRTLASRIPQLQFVSVEAVDEDFAANGRTPITNQVRYYFDAQRKEVDRIISELAPLLTTGIDAVPMLGYSEEMRKNPVIEIWLGRNETQNWTLPADRAAGEGPAGTR